MFNDDPLEAWSRPSLFGMFDFSPAEIPEQQARLSGALDRLEALLDTPPPEGKKRDFYGNGLWGFNGKMPLPPGELQRAEQLYRRVVESGGSGVKYAQEGLLDLIAATEDPLSIPFWLEMLDWQRPREQFASQRRLISLAALARMAISRDEASAYEALRGATRHAKPDARALAVYYLGEAYLQADRPVPPEVEAEVREIAVSDSDFAPRFQARSLLREAGLPVPMDNAKGVYAFKVKLDWDKRVYRTIEVRSESTLDDLHLAIQKAFRWDADHLYSFFMNGKSGDRLYEVTCDWGMGDMDMVLPPPLARELMDVAEAPAEELTPRFAALLRQLIPSGVDPAILTQVIKEIVGELPPGVDLPALLQELEKPTRPNGPGGTVRILIDDEEDEEGGSEDGDEDESEGYCVHVAVLGELGLVPKQKFLYLFDYGDQNLFEVAVVGIKPKAERGKYPRVVDSKGKASAQYQYSDEDDEDEDDQEEES